jgi:bifunctional DNase/RNase
MKKKELRILGLSYSQSQMGAYVIVLSDVLGRRKLPLIIKPLEAQRIALELEGIKSPRPLTHDLIKSVTDTLNASLKEVFIYSLAEGVFYTKLIFSNGLDDIEIESTAGDGLALSAIYKCPVTTTSEILEIAGIVINDDGTIPDDIDSDDDFINELEEELGKHSNRIISIEDLEKMMEEAISNEEYEIAAELRDKIQTLKNN